MDSRFFPAQVFKSASCFCLSKPEDDSESEDDELCPLDEEEEEKEKYVGEVQQDEDDHHAQIQQDEDKNLDEFQLEEDEQLARAIQESLSISSPPRSDTDSLFQPFAHLFPPVYRYLSKRIHLLSVTSDPNFKYHLWKLPNFTDCGKQRGTNDCLH